MKIYKPINPIQLAGSSALDELKIDVSYNKGGYNYKRGIWAYFTPVHRDTSRGFVSECCTLFGARHESGFRLLLCELGRKSQKVEDEMSAKIEKVADTIAEMWNTEDYQGIVDTIRKAM